MEAPTQARAAYCANGEIGALYASNVFAVRPSIGQALANDALGQFVGAVLSLTPSAMRFYGGNQTPPNSGADAFAAMLIGAFHAALED